MFEISFALSWRDAGGGGGEARSRRSAFARFTRYSASDIAPAIATAVPPSREKIFWTTLDPTKNPFEARLSAARTTPSLLRMPTVVVMSNLESVCRWLSMLTRIEDCQSHFRAICDAYSAWWERKPCGKSLGDRPWGSPCIDFSPFPRSASRTLTAVTACGPGRILLRCWILRSLRNSNDAGHGP